jgi:hypothetical protein
VAAAVKHAILPPHLKSSRYRLAGQLRANHLISPMATRVRPPKPILRNAMTASIPTQAANVVHVGVDGAVAVVGAAAMKDMRKDRSQQSPMS